MKTKLYSYAHLESAQKLFPLLVDKKGWLEEQWKDDEINACKQLEMNNFIKKPSLATYPQANIFQLPHPRLGEDFYIVNEILATQKNFRTFLSIGCGGGQKELMLAKSNSHISFIAIDNAPYVELLNLVAKELGLANIVFKNRDLRDGDFKNFDMVYSFAVIYCIPDEFLSNYFKLIMNALSPQGLALIGCSSNYSLKIKIIKFIRSVLPKIKKENYKQTGWLRDVRHVRRFFPKHVIIDNLYAFGYFSGKKIGRALSVQYAIEFFQKKIFPITNQSYLFVLRK